MSLAMPTHLEPSGMHNQRKASLKARIACSKMPDIVYKGIVPAIVFSLSQEPALLYQLSTFADKSEDLTQRTSYKMQDNALYIETDDSRYEISRLKGN